MTDELRCSLRECGKPLTGMVVLLKDDYYGTIDWAPAYDTVITQDGENKNELVILHTTCWEKVFNEMLAQEQMTALMFVIGGVGDVREALQIA